MDCEYAQAINAPDKRLQGEIIRGEQLYYACWYNPGHKCAGHCPHYIRRINFSLSVSGMYNLIYRIVQDATRLKEWPIVYKWLVIGGMRPEAAREAIKQRIAQND